MTANTLILIFATLSAAWVVYSLAMWWALESVTAPQDSGSLRKALSEWEPLLAECRTIRGIKLFANRLRVVAARLDIHHNGDDRLCIMAGFAALCELGETDQDRSFEDTKQFEEHKNRWKERVEYLYSRDQSEHKTRESIDVFFSKAQLQDWEEFVSLREWIVFPNASVGREGVRGSASVGG